MQASVDDRWIDESGTEFCMISYNFVPVDGSRCVLYGMLSNGEKLPLDEIKQRYKRVGMNYIGMTKKSLLNE